MKHLYRSRDERILGGVCAGIGEYADVDPTVVRIIWAVLSLLSVGLGILAYIIAWILIPEGKNERSAESGAPGSGSP